MSLSFQTQVANPSIRTSVELIDSHDQIDLYRITINFPQKQVPSPVRIDWEEDMVNLLHVWQPLGKDRSMHQGFAPNKCNSRFCSGAP